MNPNELADELEAQNYDYWLNLMLDNVPNDRITSTYVEKT